MSTEVRDPAVRPGLSSRAVAGSAALVLSGIVSTQLGAGLAARLFHQAPAAAVTGLRLWTAALVLLIVSVRGVTAAASGMARHRAGHRHARSSFPVSSRNTSSSVRLSIRRLVGSTPCSAHQAVTEASSCGVTPSGTSIT